MTSICCVRSVTDGTPDFATTLLSPVCHIRTIAGIDIGTIDNSEAVDKLAFSFSRLE